MRRANWISLGMIVTRLAWMMGNMVPYIKDEIITEFISNEDIFDCIIASSLIPFALTGSPVKIYRGWTCIDAGVTNVPGVRRFTCNNSDAATEARRGDMISALWSSLVGQDIHSEQNAESESPRSDFTSTPPTSSAASTKEAPAPYGILELTRQTSHALLQEAQGELDDALRSLRDAVEAVVTEAGEVLRIEPMSKSPPRSTSPMLVGGKAVGGGGEVMGGLELPIIPAVSQALHRYLSLSRSVHGTAGRVASKVVNTAGAGVSSATSRVISTGTAVGSAVLGAPAAVGRSVLSTTLAVGGSAVG